MTPTLIIGFILYMLLFYMLSCSIKNKIFYRYAVPYLKKTIKLKSELDRATGEEYEKLKKEFYARILIH
jgi:hypothetical protein